MGLPSLRFVDRVGELEALLRFSSRFRGVPLYIYGPEGCGKTRLLREFVGRFRERFGGRGVAVYIDALERDSVERAVLASDAVGVVVEAAASIAESAAGQPLGRVLADRIATLLQKLAARLTLSGRYLVVAVDDVARAIGVENIERYVKWLYELLWKIGEDYNPKAVNIIVTTSEGQSLKLISRHRHASIALLWNLDMQAFQQLYEQLNPPPHMDFERVWSLFAGNPAKLVELAGVYEWSLERMLEDYRDRLAPIVRDIIARGLQRQLREALEDPDTLYLNPTPQTIALEQILTENNLIIYKRVKTLTGNYIPKNPQLGVGEYYAWQTPMHRNLARQLAGRAGIGERGWPG